jgi:hypothetical protein
MMHVFTTLSAFLLAGAAAAINNSFCAPTSGDVQVVQFAYALEQRPSSDLNSLVAISDRSPASSTDQHGH